MRSLNLPQAIRPGQWRARLWRRGRLLGLVATVFLVAASVAACGSSSSGSSPTQANSASAQSARSQQLVKYAECMRTHGVPNFPDPVNGRLALNVGPSSGLDPNSSQFQSAQQACQSEAPAGLGSGSTASPQQQTQGLNFAACMREHGVANFPDPSFSGGGTVLKVPPEVANSPQFAAAQQACRSQLPAGIGGGS